MAGIMIITITKHDTIMFRLLNEEGVVDRIEVDNAYFAGSDEAFEQNEKANCKKFKEEK
jgi:hypothetical protein